jgi:hypothetical protein
MKMIRRLEGLSRPRLRFLFDHRLSNIIFGLLVIGGSVAAFFAPPFTGLDTLPSLGVVVLSLGVLLEDFLVVVLALVVGVAGVVLAVVLGNAASTRSESCSRTTGVAFRVRADAALARRTVDALAAVLTRRRDAGRVEVLSFHAAAVEQTVSHGLAGRLVISADYAPAALARWAADRALCGVCVEHFFSASRSLRRCATPA